MTLSTVSFHTTSARSSRSMEQARATASDLPAGQIQAHLFAQMPLKAYVEAAALDIDNTSSVFPVRFDQRRSDAIQPYDAR